MSRSPNSCASACSRAAAQLSRGTRPACRGYRKSWSPTGRQPLPAPRKTCHVPSHSQGQSQPVAYAKPSHFGHLPVGCSEISQAPHLSKRRKTWLSLPGDCFALMRITISMMLRSMMTMIMIAIRILLAVMITMMIVLIARSGDAAAAAPSAGRRHSRGGDSRLGVRRLTFRRLRSDRKGLQSGFQVATKWFLSGYKVVFESPVSGRHAIPPAPALGAPCSAPPPSAASLIDLYHIMCIYIYIYIHI